MSYSSWKWKPRSAHGIENTDTDPVIVTELGSSSDGEMLYSLEAPGGLTLEELKGLALWLVGELPHEIKKAEKLKKR